ncbi:hypothetical protein AB0L40_21900 [Patulibacter sp. NPDC049589]|uniref:hypothetical protein n=1 Tax=Patulibacter sp. NPDC049589 TaxID=3154731 RepID=UPI00342D1DC2
MPDRSLTPHELHQKAISVLDQLERLAVDRSSQPVPAAEIDVVTTAARDLRRRIDEAALTDPDGGAAALRHLEEARRRILEAIELVDRLAGDVSSSPVAQRSEDSGPVPDPGTGSASGS